MPGLNQKGPDGQGPMTGWKMGKCTNFGEKMKRENTEDSEGFEAGMGRGRGFGRRGTEGGRGMGRAMARGMGRGMGRGNRFRGGF